MAAAADMGRAAPCPERGASLQVALQAVADTAPISAVVTGTLTTPSCDDPAESFAINYVQVLSCPSTGSADCRATFDGLRPGEWTHRILVTAGEPLGQLQARTQLLLDRAAGSQVFAWPLYRSVQTVVSLDDALGCAGCLRAAIATAEAGFKPALVQFAPSLTGSIRLAAALPPLLSGRVTIDGFDLDGVPLTRTIDGNGMSNAALRILGPSYQILGLRVVNVGGDSDAVLLESPEASDNLLDSLAVVGRSVVPCGTDGSGCVLDGVCREVTAQSPRGFCGDDGIAVRALAGAVGPNLIRHSLISGAHDKGIKVSDGGVAVVEDSVVFGNTDGGMQATLSGQLTARRNVVFANRGTTSANGLAANGAAAGSTAAGRLETRGNLSIGNALRGISVRSLSVATLRDDFVCGNGTAGRDGGIGVAVLDAAGSSAVASATGLAVVHNQDSGVVVADNSSATFGSSDISGENAIAFNGPPAPPTPANFRNSTPFPIDAIGNLWEHCGARAACDVDAVQALDIFTASLHGPVAVAPALPTRRRAAPRITAIEPPFAAAGELVRIYGSGFDAIGGAGTSCSALAAANTCRPLRGNCVLIGRTPADVVAVTPTMLVVHAPFTCVTPVAVDVRTRWSHGFGHAQFCLVPADSAAP